MIQKQNLGCFDNTFELCPPTCAAPGEETMTANTTEASVPPWSTLKAKIHTLFQTKECVKVLKQCTAAMGIGAYTDDQMSELFIHCAACYLKLDKPTEACDDCNVALEQDATRLSACVHKTKALLKQRHHAEAEEVILAGLTIKKACFAEPTHDLRKQLKQPQKKGSTKVKQVLNDLLSDGRMPGEGKRKIKMMSLLMDHMNSSRAGLG